MSAITPGSDPVFAVLVHSSAMERIAGGSETDVYRSEDDHYVVKVKRELGGTLDHSLMWARTMRAVAEEFIAYLGPDHSLANYYVIAQDEIGRVQVLVIQPLLHAQPLSDVDYRAMSAAERTHIALQLRDLIRRALTCWRETGHLPDLHGTRSVSAADRKRINTIALAPRRIWQFFVDEHVLRSNNLLLTDEPDHCIVLVDYDLLRWRPVPRRTYLALRWLLFWRDHWLVWRLLRRGVGIIRRSYVRIDKE
jgi:hypothetical protein